MDPVATVPSLSSPDLRDSEVERGIGRAVLRLVKSRPERRAIEAGEADAILDPRSGSAFLLPGAQRWLMERAAREFRQAANRGPKRQEHLGLDGLSAQVGVLDAAGIVLSANQAWRDGRRGSLGAPVPEGQDYLAACHADADADADADAVERMALVAGIRQVIAGERKRFWYEHAGDLAGRRWITFSITRATGERDGRAIVLREDITERKRGELLLALEYRVARCLADADTAVAGLQAVIRAVCEAQGWECGRYFRLDAAKSALSCQASWGVARPAVQDFLAKSRGLELPVNTGLKGRVFRTGHPLWVLSDGPDDTLSHAALAPHSDTHGAFIFPVASEYRTTGVLAFSGGICREPDDLLLATVVAIGGQLGRFVQRQRALDSLRRSEERFRRLTLLASDWHWEQDRDCRFTASVGAGALAGGDVLGKALWELPNIVRASADWDAHRAQVGEHWSFCDFEFTVIEPDGRTGHYSISGEPILDETGAFIGYWGTGLDITQRKRNEIALRESETDLRAMIAKASA